VRTWGRSERMRIAFFRPREKTMPLIRRIHASLLIAGLAVAAAAHAAPVNEVTTEYYSDSSKTVLVGERILSCGGGVRKWGRTTGFSTKFQDSCGKRIRTTDTPLAHMLLHHDPYYACTRRCERLHPLTPCGQDEDCGAEKRECLQACQDLLGPPPTEDPAAVAAPGPASAPEPEAKTR
jgi:hypothetical protein